MPFVPVPRTAMAELRYIWDSQQCENTLYFQYPTDPENANMLDLAEALYDWWVAELKPIQSAACALREVHITSLVSATSGTYTRVSSPAEPGLSLSPTLPNSVSFVVSFRTFLRGRSFRGRNYAVGLTEGDVTGNTISGSYAADLQGAYAAIPAAVNPVDWTWGVVSRFSNGAPRTTGLFTPVATVAVVDGTVDSQRRRLPGRGY